MKKHNKYALLGLKALERAAAKVAENARKNKYKIPIWKNGRIEYEIPGIITEQSHSPDPKHAAILRKSSVDSS
jgi:hypothetical protein